MRYLSQLELENWAQKLGKVPPGPYGGNPFYPKSINTNLSTTIRNNFDDHSNRVNYKFSFSISINNRERFETLTKKFLNDGFEIKNSDNKIHVERLANEDLHQINSFLTTTQHSTYGVDFVRYTYEFKQFPILPLIIFVQTIQDVIEIIGNFWSFDENGKEICQIKYPVGTIVSLKNDRGDFIIESVEFLRTNTNNFQKLKTRYNIKDELVLYHLIKIVSNQNSQVLQYEDKDYISSSEEIIPNRGQRLDELLG